MVASRTPGTPIAKIERTPTRTPGGSSKPKEEKIFVTVRVRPLSKKELAVKDQAAWECADSQTIIYKGPPQDRAAPTSYTFDKVFGPSCQTDLVYEDGAKDVAMSALTGINATIFAYGQTSSGKTYTMRGVTESAVGDIYRHMENTPEREFVIKISAIEIYNEIVKDLLQPDSGPLRLLDDPEKGPIVEKLDEQIAKNREHLRHLIGICEEQRQVGETALNDTSSRSHQIIRLTVESRLREASGCVKSFVASLNFVDLAGSERVAQTHAIGARLKEGCHINLSLLTLTKVIRKLSSEKRSGHIPYRDSKLTRILQLSLGGNARTAIICTMSPALTHVEQSRNTLFFAACAKEVTNTAKVNMIVSDKQLVKHLQTEVARLEAELRTPDRASSSEILRMEKDRKIRQMELEMEELKKERDNACSQLEELRKKMDDNQQGWNPFDSPQKARKCLTFSGSLQPKMITIRNSIRQSSTAPLTLKHEIRKLEQLQQQLEVEANRAIEVLHKEVDCHKHGNQDAAETIAKLQAEIREMQSVRPENRDVEMITDEGNGSDLKDEISRLHMQDSDIAKLEAKLENVQKSIDKLVMSLPIVGTQLNESSTKSNVSKKKRRVFLPLGMSNINRAIRAPCSPHSSSRPSESEVENLAPDGHTVSHEDSEKATRMKSEENGDISSRDETPRRRSSSVNMKKMQRMFQNAAEENVRNIRDYVTELKERVAKLQYQKQLLVCQVLELESNEGKPNDMEEDPEETAGCLQDGPAPWDGLFKAQMQHIIQLWGLCHVSIIHRTQFYRLFRGDPADQIYIEVEVRRLLWLQQHLDEVGDASPAAPGDDLAVSRASSIKALRNEREFLARRVGSRLTEEERERLLIKWQVPLEAKQRKLQLVNKLWTDPEDPAHIEESADLVARLVGFCEGGNISKEMFELNFAVPTCRKPWLMGWRPISSMIKERAQTLVTQTIRPSQ